MTNKNKILINTLKLCFLFLYTPPAIAESKLPLLPNINRICKAPEEWVLDLAKKQDASGESKSILEGNDSSALQQPFVTNLMSYICDRLGPLAAVEVPAGLSYRTMLVSDLYSRIDSKLANEALHLIEVFEEMIGSSKFEYKVGDSARIYTYRSNDRSTLSEPLYSEETKSDTFHTSTRIVHPMVYEHPLYKQIDLSSQTTKLIRLIKKGIENALYKDKAFNSSAYLIYDVDSTYNPFNYVMSRILNLQEYKNPELMPDAWFYSTDTVNHWLVGQLSSIILYTLKHDNGHHYQALDLLLEWYGHAIFKYKINLDRILKEILSTELLHHGPVEYIVRSLFIKATEENKDLLLDAETLGLFLIFDTTDMVKGFFRTLTATQIENLMDALIDHLEEVAQLDRVGEILNSCTDLLSPESFSRLNELWKDTRSVRGLFKIVQCDSKTFNCSNLKYDLKNYYLASEPEVQDILTVAMNAFLRQGKTCAPHFKFDQTVGGGAVAGYFSTGYSSALGCEVVINFYDRVSSRFWGTFVHEMAHKAFHVVFRNNAKPYNDQESQESYKQVMDPISAYLMPNTSTTEGKLWFFTLQTRRLLGAFIMASHPYWLSIHSRTYDGIFQDMMSMPELYPKQEWDAENVVRYYEHLVLDGRSATDRFYPGMREFHRKKFVKHASDAGFLQKP